MIRGSTSPPCIALIDFDPWAHGHFRFLYCHFCKMLLELGCRVVGICADPSYVSRWLEERGICQENLLLHSLPITPAWLRSWRRKWRLLRHLVCWFQSAQILSQTQKSQKWTVQGAFVAWAHSLLENGHPSGALLDHIFPFPWAVLWADSEALRSPGKNPRHLLAPLTGKYFRTVAVLDEGTLSAFKSVLGPSRVLDWPDFTDNTLPLSPPFLLTEMRARARGRPVIGSFGVMGKRKNTALLLAYAEKHADLFFLVAGLVNLDWYPPEEREIICRAKRGELENVLLHDGFLSEGDLNAFIQASDIIYAVYRDFPNSSNILTKAAVFKRPVVVADGFCMAERVRRYEIGKVIPQDDFHALDHAIRALLTSPPHPDEFQLFGEAHSEKRLKHQMAQLVGVLTHAADTDSLPPIFSTVLNPVRS
jgi:glycosyltransferase involved in cell wall biosynthesis